MASGVPGVPEQVGEDYVIRRIKALERRVDELGPSLMAGVADAIGSTVAFTSLYGSAAGFAVPSGTSASILTRTFDVPDGFTRAAVMAVGYTFAKNGGAGYSYLYGQIRVDSQASGLQTGTLAASGSYGFSYPALTANLTGLSPGGVITVNLDAKGDPAWGSDSANGASMSALAMFAR